MRIIKARKELVWTILTDMENWPSWSPHAHNRVVYHHIIDQKDNFVVCDEIEQSAGFFKTRHIDKYILIPTNRIEEIILEGDLSGGFEMTLLDHQAGTLVTVKTDITPKNLWIKILDFFIGNRILHGFWEDLLGQLALKAET